MYTVPVKDKIEYTVALVSDFAKKYSLSTTQAFNYLDRFNAISLLEQHYNVAHTLSFSEMQAIIHIFDELDGMEGVLVASKIADRVGITRSVIVNALRKFESAGVIESRSSGMKGTYIKVINDVVFSEIKKLKQEM